ncbi:hypothetical protein [Dictyobacter aurantiacus]|nr:hypothetical protein [Dictyobacter aurantiacus]
MEERHRRPSYTRENYPRARFIRLILLVVVIILLCLLYFFWPYVASFF